MLFAIVGNHLQQKRIQPVNWVKLNLPSAKRSLVGTTSQCQGSIPFVYKSGSALSQMHRVLLPTTPHPHFVFVVWGDRR
ncbi:MAG: hypothetical protein ABG776_08265, partial [Cyanobacteria bacterium J06555_13]